MRPDRDRVDQVELAVAERQRRLVAADEPLDPRQVRLRPRDRRPLGSQPSSASGYAAASTRTTRPDEHPKSRPRLTHRSRRRHSQRADHHVGLVQPAGRGERAARHRVDLVRRGLRPSGQSGRRPPSPPATSRATAAGTADTPRPYPHAREGPRILRTPRSDARPPRCPLARAGRTACSSPPGSEASLRRSSRTEVAGETLTTVALTHSRLLPSTRSRRPQRTPSASRVGPRRSRSSRRRARCARSATARSYQGTPRSS